MNTSHAVNHGDITLVETLSSVKNHSTSCLTGNLGRKECVRTESPTAMMLLIRVLAANPNNRALLGQGCRSETGHRRCDQAGLDTLREQFRNVRKLAQLLKLTSVSVGRVSAF